MFHAVEVFSIRTSIWFSSFEALGESQVRLELEYELEDQVWESLKLRLRPFTCSWQRTAASVT